MSDKDEALKAKLQNLRWWSPSSWGIAFSDLLGEFLDRIHERLDALEQRTARFSIPVTFNAETGYHEAIWCSGSAPSISPAPPPKASEHEAGDLVNIRTRLAALLEEHRNDRSLLLRLLVFVEARAKPAPALQEAAVVEDFSPPKPWLDVPPPPAPPEKTPYLTPAEDLMATLMAGHARFLANGGGAPRVEMLFLVNALQNLNERMGALEPPKYGIPGVPEHDCVFTYGPGKCRGRCVNAIKAGSQPAEGT